MRRLLLFLLTAGLSVRAGETVNPPGPLPPLPSAAQLAWQNSELALFLRFDLVAFTDGTGDPGKFNPTGLDPKQWITVAKECGFKRLILSAKNRDGFCLWPTKTSDFSIAHTPWHDGKGDIVREFIEACHKADIDPGIYLSIDDAHSRPVGTTDSVYIQQLTEILSNYGPIAEVRFDGAGGEGTGAVPVIDEKAASAQPPHDRKAFFTTVRKLQPRAIIVSNVGPDARWNGNNIGHAGEPQWSTFNPATLPGPLLTKREQLSLLNLGDPKGPVWCPAECFVRLRPNWSWNPAEDSQILPIDKLISTYCKSAGRNCVLLLNVPLDSRGLIPDAEAQRLRELHEATTKIFAHDLARGGTALAGNVRGNDPEFAAARAIDGNDATFWAADDSETGESFLEIDFNQPVQFNLVEMREPVSIGQRVITYRIDAWDGAAWNPIVPNGKSIGRRKIEQLKTRVTATKVRLVIQQSRAAPAISGFSLYLK